MPDDAVSTFSDEPIQNADDDLLGRGPFVRRLATVLNSWTGDSSIVVGLHAPWGEGKTSLINLLCPMLASNGFQVLRFNPWEWASRADLNDAFFDEIAVQLGHSSRKETIEIAKRWRRYATRLKGAAKAVSITLPLFKVVLVLCAGLSAIGLVWPSRTILVAIFTLLCFTGAAKWLANLFPAVADVIAPNDKDSDSSLEQIRKGLNQELTGWKGRILVVVDDVDRLDPQQTADVLRLIKANGDLPKISFLLVGDRQIIANHVGTGLCVDGSAYLEKVIQLSFDLPSINQTILNRVFFEGVDFVLAAPGMSKDFDPVRWANVFWSGIAPSISSLRSVKRLLATLQFHFDMLNGGEALEVNPTDLVALETMRLFEPKLHRAVRASRSQLLDQPGHGAAVEQLAENVIDELLETAMAAHRPEWKIALKTLFPVVNSRGAKVKVDKDTVRSWDRERRVSSHLYFDRYFTFGVMDGELSESSFQRFMEADTHEAFREQLVGFEKHQLLLTVIERLRGSVKDVELYRIEPLVCALFDMSESLSIRSAEMFGVSPLFTSESTVDAMLKRLDPNDVEGVLDRSFAETSGLKLPIEFVRRLWIHERENRLDYPFVAGTIQRWQADMVSKIAAASASGDLMGKDGTLLYLNLWAEWGNLTDARQAVSDAIGTTDGIIEFLRGLVVVAHSTNRKKRGGTERPYMRHTDISRFVDPELVYASLGMANEDRAKVLRQIHPEVVHFEKALERLRLGKSDEAFDIADDDDD